MAAKHARKHANRIAREAALSLLYSSDIAASDVEQVIEEGRYPADDLQLSDYAEQLVLGVVENLEDVDARLASTSENWAVDRMPVVDRAILRLAVFEMVYVDDVPVSVAINEAVELAKDYGGEDESARFVNGVLGRIARALEDAGGGEHVPDAAEQAEPAEHDTADIEEPAQPAEHDASGITQPAEPAELEEHDAAASANDAPEATDAAEVADAAEVESAQGTEGTTPDEQE